MIIDNCNPKNFIKKIQGKTLVCYGAGTGLPVFLKQFEGHCLENVIAYICDANPSLWGTVQKHGNATIEICSPETLCKRADANTIIVITCWPMMTVLRFLNDLPELSQTTCYSNIFMHLYPDENLARVYHETISNPKFTKYREQLLSLSLKDKHNGQRCFIVGNGPSLRIEDLNRLKNEITFGMNYINFAFDQTDWRPTYYIMADSIGYLLGSPCFQDENIQHCFLPINMVETSGKIYENAIYYNRLSMKNETDFSDHLEKGIYISYSVSYGALQIASYMGFNEIYLIGFDNQYSLEKDGSGDTVCNTGIADHFYAESDDISLNGQALTIYFALYGRNSVEEAYSADTTSNFITAKDHFDFKGVKIFNATRGGSLEVFPRISFDSLWNENKEGRVLL